MRQIGRYKIGIVELETFGLDGGAMFGSIPKVLWEKQIQSDAKNRIPLVTRVLYLQSADHKILVDCGNGQKWNSKQNAIFNFAPNYSQGVQELFPNLDKLILTHLHFDHAAGSVYLDHDIPMLSFPNTEHYLQKANWERANSPGVREKASYLRDTIDKLTDADLRLVEDNFSPAPGITLHRSEGHTQGLQWILLRDERDIVAYPSDLIPTAHHISIPFVMGYDLWPEKTMVEKELFLNQACEENWLIIFEHDSETIGGRVARSSDSRFVFTAEDLSDLRYSSL